MPRVAKTEDTESVTKPVRRRVSRTVSAGEKPTRSRATTTRARAPRTPRSAKVVHDDKLETTPMRRAPTNLPAETASRRSIGVGAILCASVAVLFIGAGVVIGVQDRGEINVAQIIEERNERIARGELLEGEIANPVSSPNTPQNNPLRPAEVPSGGAAVETLVSVEDDSIEPLDTTVDFEMTEGANVEEETRAVSE